jgi:eukaryotic-like serine/threonine-protein kinase
VGDDRWVRIETIYHAALERPIDARAGFLADACEGDAGLQAEVERLLRHDADAAEFLETPAIPPRPSLVGQRFGVYEVASFIAAGGMGEVFTARDTRLGREVALKVIPGALIADSGRLARLEREARLLASLNHPNIAQIYGLEAGALAMELVDGPTLDELIGRPAPRRDPQAVSKSAVYLPLARQIASALEAAHARGIIHRDLKPANIKVTAAGVVKVLDFGLAKALGPEHQADPGQRGGLHSTESGVILGTAAYMSPEQARALAVDKRTDIWAFGCVLYELVTGRRAFPGETLSDTLARVLEHEPDWTALPATTPPTIRRLLRRCLQKDLANRLHDIADARIELDEAEVIEPTPEARPVDGTSPPPAALRERVGARVGLMFAAACVLVVVWYMSAPSVDLGAYRYTPFETGTGTPNDPAWSPDGRSIAYDMTVNGRSQIFVRSLDSDSPAQLTFLALDARQPFWWPGASRVGFVSDFKVWSVSPAGGEPELVSAPKMGQVLAAAVSPDGQTLATWARNRENTFWSVWLGSSPGAEFHEYAPPLRSQLGGDYLRFSPDGRRLLLSGVTDTGEVAIWLLPFPDGGSPPERLVPKIPWTGPESAPTGFSWMPDSRRAVMQFTTASAPKGGLWMMDVRTGASAPLLTGLTQHGNPSVSPDGSRIAFTAGGASYDLAEVPLDDSPMRERLANDAYSAAWVPGSSKYVYLTNKNGEEELRIHSQTDNWDRPIVGARRFARTKATAGLTHSDVALISPVASRDGRVAYGVWNAEGVSAPYAIWISPESGGEPFRLSPDGASEGGPAWSPDGQWIACKHDEGGRTALAIVRAGARSQPQMLAHDILDTIPAWSPDGQWIAYRTRDALRLVSPDGARNSVLKRYDRVRGNPLVWSRDGGSLYSLFRTAEGLQVVAIDTKTGAERVVNRLASDFVTGVPIGVTRFTLAQDGKSFLATAERTRRALWILDDFAPRPGILDWFRRRRWP